VKEGRKDGRGEERQRNGSGGGGGVKRWMGTHIGCSLKNNKLSYYV
jgi:hypothetical protein